MKTFKGKAIYNPNGKAGEYSYWACKFYVGCSNGCTYCYCKKGVLATQMGGDTPTLKKCFKSEEHALEVFERELKTNLPELQKHGLFFSFTTDQFLKETEYLTTAASFIAIKNGVPVKILTKIAFDEDYFLAPFRMAWLKNKIPYYKDVVKKYIAFGFTLTGHDELEPNASTNAERIEAMRKLHEEGFKTFASLEPIIDIRSTCQMFEEVYRFCDLLKIGLESGKKYNSVDLRKMILSLTEQYPSKAKIYFKDRLLKQAGINRSDLPENCVGMDYNMFNQ